MTTNFENKQDRDPAALRPTTNVTDDAETPSSPKELNLCDRIRARFEPFGGVELDLPRRMPVREPPTFE